MRCVLYCENTKELISNFGDFFDDNNIKTECISNVVLGDGIAIFSHDNIKNIVCDLICEFIVVYYLRDIIFLKIYDDFNINEPDVAAAILFELTNEFKKCDVFDCVNDTLVKSHHFHFDYFMAFHRKFVLKIVNRLIDCICGRMIFKRASEMYAFEFADFFAFSDMENIGDSEPVIRLKNNKSENSDK